MHLFDTHVHTAYSPDSREELENYIKHTVDLGRNTFIFTDHVDYDAKYMGSDILIDYDDVFRNVERLKTEYDVDILVGVEMGYRVDYHPSINDYIKKYDFDIVLLSVHDNMDGDYYNTQFHDKFETRDLMKIYFNDIYNAVSNMDNYDTITHLDYLLRVLQRDFQIEDYREFIVPILEEIVSKGKCLEINTKTVRSAGHFEYCKYIIDLYIECGGTEFTLGSDAHQVEDYESGFNEIISYLKSRGISYLNVFKERKAVKIDI